MTCLEPGFGAHAGQRVAPRRRRAVRALREHGDQHRPLHVLVQRLREPQLLRPLGVEPDRLHVDAGARDLEFVQSLHGLQLEDARAAEPGEHQVLRHLRVRAGGGAERAGGRVSVEIHGEIEAAGAGGEPGCWKVEDRLVAPEFAEHATDERGKRVRYEFSHGRIVANEGAVRGGRICGLPRYSTRSSGSFTLARMPGSSTGTSNGSNPILAGRRAAARAGRGERSPIAAGPGMRMGCPPRPSYSGRIQLRTVAR